MTYEEARGMNFWGIVIDGKDYYHIPDEYLDIVDEALEKQIPKFPIYSNYEEEEQDDDKMYLVPKTAICPFCGHEFEFGRWNSEDNHHCVCGQTIEWEDWSDIIMPVGDEWIEHMIDEIEGTDWYNINQKGELVHGAVGDGDALYKAEEILAICEKFRRNIGE